MRVAIKDGAIIKEIGKGLGGHELRFQLADHCRSVTSAKKRMEELIMNKPARLDQDRLAQPLTEIIQHVPNDQKCRGPVPADDAQLVYRPTDIHKTLNVPLCQIEPFILAWEDEKPEQIRSLYAHALKKHGEDYLQAAEKLNGGAKKAALAMAAECCRLRNVILFTKG